MELSIRYVSCILAVLGFALPLVHGAPVLTGGSILSGSFCEWWVEPVSGDTYKLSLQCNQLGRGVKAQGGVLIDWDSDKHWTTSWTDKNSLGTVHSVDFKTRNLRLAQISVYMGASGNADMGSCTAELVEVEQLIKNAWYSKVTCTDISEHLRVRAVLDIPGAFNQETRWTKVPGTMQTLERESWWGKPSAYAEWDIRRDYLPQ